MPNLQFLNFDWPSVLLLISLYRHLENGYFSSINEDMFALTPSLEVL